MKPNMTSDRNMPAKAGLPHAPRQPLEGALVKRCALRRLMAPGTVRPWISEPSTGEIEHVAGADDLPVALSARVGEQAVRRGELQEEDIEQEGRAADLPESGWFHRERGDRVPDRHARRR